MGGGHLLVGCVPAVLRGVHRPEEQAVNPDMAGYILLGAAGVLLGTVIVELLVWLLS